MTKQRMALFLAVSLAALLALTACAGVAEVQTGSGPAAPMVFGASVDALSLPALSLAPAQANTMLRSVSLAEKLVEQAAQTQQQFYGPGGCDHGGAMYGGGDL